MEIARDTILSGKAKIMIAGGYDDISEEGSYEFANMKATSNADTEFAMGREPAEMSRPATSTRSGVSLKKSLTHFNRLIAAIVHGGARYRYTYCHECQDRSRIRLSHSRNCCVYLDFDVCPHILNRGVRV